MSGRRRSNIRQYSAEDQALNQISKEADERLQAKRAARAEAREIRLREIEKQQKEADDKQDRVSGLSNEHSKRSQLSASRISSKETTDVLDGRERERDLKGELREMEEKYRVAMMTSATLDNEKQTLGYKLELLKDQMEELEESHIEIQREHKDRCRELELKKRAFNELEAEVKILKEHMVLKDKLIEDSGFVIMPTGDGDYKLEKNTSMSNGPVPSGGSVLLSSESIEMLKDAGEGSLGTAQHLSCRSSPVHDTQPSSSTEPDTSADVASQGEVSVEGVSSGGVERVEGGEAPDTHSRHPQHVSSSVLLPENERTSGQGVDDITMSSESSVAMCEHVVGTKVAGGSAENINGVCVDVDKDVALSGENGDSVGFNVGADLVNFKTNVGVVVRNGCDLAMVEGDSPSPIKELETQDVGTINGDGDVNAEDETDIIDCTNKEVESPRLNLPLNKSTDGLVREDSGIFSPGDGGASNMGHPDHSVVKGVETAEEEEDGEEFYDAVSTPSPYAENKPGNGYKFEDTNEEESALGTLSADDSAASQDLPQTRTSESEEEEEVDNVDKYEGSPASTEQELDDGVHSKDSNLILDGDSLTPVQLLTGLEAQLDDNEGRKLESGEDILCGKLEDVTTAEQGGNSSSISPSTAETMLDDLKTMPAREDEQATTCTDVVAEAGICSETPSNEGDSQESAVDAPVKGDADTGRVEEGEDTPEEIAKNHRESEIDVLVKKKSSDLTTQESTKDEQVESLSDSVAEEHPDVKRINGTVSDEGVSECVSVEQVKDTSDPIAHNSPDVKDVSGTVTDEHVADVKEHTDVKDTNGTVTDKQKLKDVSENITEEHTDVKDVSGTVTDEQVKDASETITDEQVNNVIEIITDGQEKDVIETITDDEFKDVSGTVTDERLKYVGGIVTDELTDLKDVSGTVTDEQVKDASGTVADEQVKDVGGTVTDKQIKDVGGTVTDEQVKDASGTVTDEQIKDVSETVTDEQVKDVGGTVTDEQVKDVCGTVTDEQIKDVSGTVTDEQVKDVGGTVTDEQVKDASGTVTDEQIKYVSGTVTDEQVKDVGGTVTDEQVKDASGIVTDEQVKDVSGTITDEQIKDASTIVTDEQIKYVSGTVTDEQVKDVSGTVTDEQVKDVSGTVTDEQVKDVSGTVTDEQVKDVSNIVTDEQVKDVSGTVTDEQIKDVSGTVTDEQVKDASTIVTDEQVKDVSGTVTDEQIKDVSGTVTDEQVKDVSGTVTDEQVKDVSGTVTDEQVKDVSGTVTVEGGSNIVNVTDECTMVKGVSETIEGDTDVLSEHGSEGTSLITASNTNTEGNDDTKKDDTEELTVLHQDVTSATTPENLSKRAADLTDVHSEGEPDRVVESLPEQTKQQEVLTDGEITTEYQLAKENVAVKKVLEVSSSGDLDDDVFVPEEPKEKEEEESGQEELTADTVKQLVDCDRKISEAEVSEDGLLMDSYSFDDIDEVLDESGDELLDTEQGLDSGQPLTNRPQVEIVVDLPETEDHSEEKVVEADDRGDGTGGGRDDARSLDSMSVSSGQDVASDDRVSTGSVASDDQTSTGNVAGAEVITSPPPLSPREEKKGKKIGRFFKSIFK